MLFAAPSTVANAAGANSDGPYSQDESRVGQGEPQGNSQNPNGTRGKADDWNPPGQVDNDRDRGYECDDNKGVGDKGGNPAHTGCGRSGPGEYTPPEGGGGGTVTPPQGGGTMTPPQGGGTVAPTQGGGFAPAQGGGFAPAQGGGFAPTQGGGFAPAQGGGFAPTEQPVPTVVPAGVETAGVDSSLLLTAGAAGSTAAGLALLLIRRRAQATPLRALTGRSGDLSS